MPGALFNKQIALMWEVGRGEEVASDGLGEILKLHQGDVWTLGVPPTNLVKGVKHFNTQNLTMCSVWYKQASFLQIISVLWIFSNASYQRWEADDKTYRPDWGYQQFGPARSKLFSSFLFSFYTFVIFFCILVLHGANFIRNNKSIKLNVFKVQMFHNIALT